MRLLRSPDCTLTGSMIPCRESSTSSGGQRPLRACLLAGAPSPGSAAARSQTCRSGAGLRRFPLPSPAQIALPLAGRPRPGRAGAIAEAAPHHRQRDDDRGPPGRRRRRAADLPVARPGRARHAADADPRRGRPERHVRRELRRAGPDPHQRTAQGRRVLRRQAALGHGGGLRLLQDAGGSPLPNGDTTACSTTPCWPCAASGRR